MFPISINLSELPHPIRNKIIGSIKKQNVRYQLENQILSIDIKTMKKICEDDIALSSI